MKKEKRILLAGQNPGEETGKGRALWDRGRGAMLLTRVAHPGGESTLEREIGISEVRRELLI